MGHFYQNIGHILLILVLLCFSAFFSGAETAYFNLSRRQIAFLKRSEHKVSRLAARLVAEPGRLLGSLLFGNMAVNILFFASSSVLVIKVKQDIGMAAATVTAVGTFSMLVFFGEILPKSISYTNSKKISVAAALPGFVCVKIFTPIVSVFRFFIVEPIIRLLMGTAKPPKPITKQEFKLLIEQVKKRGLITANENRVIGEIAELGFIKVRNCLRPRVDMIACDVKRTPREVCNIMQKNRLTKVPVYFGKIDNIIGLVYLRDLLLQPENPLSKVVRKVNFVPEQKMIESLLEFFRKTHTDMAVVVDEYGGIAGSIRLEDIAEEILGPIDTGSDIEPVVQTGPLQYRLSGNLTIHNWADSFGIEPAENRIATIGGLVSTLLGKIPKSGDVARYENLKFTVEKVKKRRIETIIMTFEPLQNNDK